MKLLQMKFTLSHPVMRLWSQSVSVGVLVFFGPLAGASAAEPLSEASENVLAEQLPESTITALRYAEDLSKIPNSVSVLSERDLIAPQFYSLPDALGSLPGVMNQKTAQGHGSPYIRGFTSFRNLMLIDGIRFNNSVFREGPNQYWSMIDSYGLGSVELVRGPGSMLYGSDAIGGTVNGLTRGTRYQDGDVAAGQFYSGGAMDVRYDSSGDSGIYRLEGVMGQGEKWGLRVGYTLKNFGDIRAAGIGTMGKTGYDEWDADLRFDYALNGCTSMTIVHQQVSQDDVWRTHKTIYGFDWEGADHGNELRRSFDQDRSLTYLRFEGRETGAFVDDWQLTASFQTMDEERTRIKSSGKSDIQGFDVDTYGVALQLESDTELGRWVYGLDYYQDRVDSYKRKYDSSGNLTGIGVQGPVGDDARYDTFGLFLQDVWDVNEKWDVTLGSRYSYVKADIGTVDDLNGGVISINDSWDTATFSGRALYEANDCWNLFGGISQGFRAPNLSDLSRLDSARSDEFEIPSPGLDPEYFTTFEVGGHFSNESANLNFAIFYTDVRDMIVRTPTGNVDPVSGDKEITKKNAGDGYVWGMEVSGDWEFVPQWTLFGQAAWTDSSVSTYPTSAPVLVDEPLSRQMPLMGNIGVRWMHPEGTFWIEGVVNAAAKADQLSTRDKGDSNRIPPGGTPSYVVPSLRGGWEATDHLTLTLALENLTDEEYRIHGSGVNEPGFHAVLGASVRW